MEMYFSTRILSNPYFARDIEQPISHIVDTAKVRLHVILGFLLVGFLAVSIRLLFLMSGVTSQSYDPVAPSLGGWRANITDRNGETIATTLTTSSLYANANQILDIKEAVSKLRQVFPDMTAKELESKLAAGKNFVWLKRNLTPRQQDAVNHLGIPGVYFKKEYKRIYPQGALMSHMVGYTDIDNRGIAGVEQKFNQALLDSKEPLVLSLDVRVQHVLHDELARGMAEFRAKGASGIVMDAKTNEVIAMVSLPDFDPNHPNKIKEGEAFNANTLGIYEMGSIFKLFTLAMGLESGKTRLSGGYDASVPFKIGNFKVTDMQAKNRWLSIPEVFIYSSNIGTVKIALEVGAKRQREFYKQLGFMEPLKLEIPENGSPIRPASALHDLTTATLSYGYGIAVSPMQVINAIVTMVNGGVWKHPTLLLNGNKDKPSHQVISEATSEKMRRLMRLTVLEGTGKKAHVEGYVVGGKTGSANKRAEGSAGYVKIGKHRSIFASVFPMIDPKYVMLVILDEPKGTAKTAGFSTGGWTSAPISGSVIKRIAPLLGVLPTEEKSAVVQSAMRIESHRYEGGKGYATR